MRQLFKSLLLSHTRPSRESRPCTPSSWKKWIPPCLGAACASSGRHDLKFDTADEQFCCIDALNGRDKCKFIHSTYRVEKLAVHNRQRPRVERRDKRGLRIIGKLSNSLQVGERNTVKSLLQHVYQSAAAATAATSATTTPCAMLLKYECGTARD